VKLRFILNARSGHIRRDPALAGRLRAFIARHQLDATVVLTEAPCHATELTRAALAEGCTAVVAVGGDGTVNEVAQALVGTPASLGLVPLGSGNGLARDLGVPLRTAAALEVLLHGRPRMIDVGYANDRPFFCAMGTGFDADLVQRFNQCTRRGLATYLRLGALQWWRQRPERFTVRAGDTRLELTALLVAVANAAQFGNNARIAPGARVDDGLLDLVVVPPATLGNALPLAWRLFAGTLDRHPQVRRLCASSFTIERARPGLFHTDGELGPPVARIEVAVRPSALRVLVPAAR
jgi:YegS/Rv2252/BmrU family lipid kinase